MTTQRQRREWVNRVLRRYSAKDFRSGDPNALIDRFENLVQSGAPLTDEEVQLIVGALQATAGKEIVKQEKEWDLACEIEGHLRNGLPLKDAISKVGIDPATGEYRPGLSARTLKRAIANFRALADGDRVPD